MSRVAIRWLAFGCLGALTTVIVCWWLALQTDWRTGPRRNFRTGLSMLAFPAPTQNTTWTFFPITQWGVLQLCAANSGLEDVQDGSQRPAERLAEDHEVPAWSVMRRGDPRGVFGAVYLEQGFGFPLLGMAQQFRWTDASPNPQVDGVLMPNGFRPLGPGEWVPTRFIPLGFLADSALYGWLWFALLSFPGVVVRSIRGWRGVCVGCGYDLRHATHERCPECGRRC